MTQVIINHDGKISNAIATEAVQKFIKVNSEHKNNAAYDGVVRIMTTKGFRVKVVESKHPDESTSPCSAVFTVTK